MKLTDLLSDVEYRNDSDISNIEISSVVSDTNSVKKGALFTCIKGSRSDGHLYVPRAATRGAVAAVCEIGADIPDVKIPIVWVSNTRKAISYISSRFYGKPQNKLRIIGITGTNGKSSTAYILHRILTAGGYKTGLIGTIHCLIDDKPMALDGLDADLIETMTTPDPEILFKILAQMSDEGVDYVVMEVSSHALALDKVSPIRFDTAIFTNLSPEHLDFHNDMEQYYAAKLKLFEQCDTGIFNLDDLYGKRCAYESHCRVIGYSVKENANYYADNIKYMGLDGSEYSLKCYSAYCNIRCNIPGEFSVYNTLAAASCALRYGIPPYIISETIKSITGVHGRLQRVPIEPEKADYSVFIDYAHTAEAMKNLLTSVSEMRNPEQRIITLFGCGGDRDKSKRGPMGRAAAKLSDVTIITSDNSRSEAPVGIIEDIISGVINEIDPKKAHVFIIDRSAAIRYAIENAKKGDIILLVGKGHEAYEIDAEGKHPFNEIEIVQKTVNEIYYKKDLE